MKGNLVCMHTTDNSCSSRPCCCSFLLRRLEKPWCARNVSFPASLEAESSACIVGIYAYDGLPHHVSTSPAAAGIQCSTSPLIFLSAACALRSTASSSPEHPHCPVHPAVWHAYEMRITCGATQALYVTSLVFCSCFLTPLLPAFAPPVTALFPVSTVFLAVSGESVSSA